MSLHIEAAALREALSRLHVTSEHGLQSALEQVCMATTELFGVTGSGLMVLDDEQILRYIAASDEDGKALERSQEIAGEGPCVDALIGDVVVRTPDVTNDERWPALAPILAETPIRAVLGIPVQVAGSAIGSLNVYRDAVYEWDDSDVEALRSFNAVVEQLVGAALLAESREAVIEQLSHALESRVVIERAVGAIMATQRVDAVSAFNQLRADARSQRRKVADLAEEILGGFQP